jgi:hypothetical protein
VIESCCCAPTGKINPNSTVSTAYLRNVNVTLQNPNVSFCQNEDVPTIALKVGGGIIVIQISA